MRTFIALILVLTTFSFFTSSCEKSESYADKVKKEKKAINRLKADSGFVFITEYPENGKFKPNEFFRDPVTGAYFNVVDSGNGNRAVSTSEAKAGTNISVRYKDSFFFAGSTNIDSTNVGVGHEQNYIQFTFDGRGGNYMGGSYYSPTVDFYFLSPGMVAPLFYVGENAVVRLIIPFTAGSNYQANYGFEPVFMGYVNYKFIAE